MPKSIYQSQILWRGQAFSVPALRSLLKTDLDRVKDWERAVFSFTLEWLDEEKEEFIIQTSGSTGTAKQIVLTRKQMVLSAQATGNYLGLQAGNKTLLALPAQFIAGKMMIVRALVLGLDIHCLAPKLHVLEHIDQEFDFCALIPLQIQYAIDHQLIHQIEKLGKVIIGGAPLSKSYQEKIKDLSSKLYATYGMTETITHIAMKRLNGPNTSEYYQSLPGISVEKDSEDCLMILSERLPSKITHTNDRVHLISDREFEVLGRVDFVINSGGLKIQPEEIEEKLRSLLNHEFMIGSKADLMLGHKLVLIIEAQEAQVNQQALFQEMKRLLPKNKIPKEVLFVPELFRTKNHKLDRARNMRMVEGLKEGML